NYYGKEVIAPGKAVPAEDVARAIIGLIENPRAEIFVGRKGKMASAMKAFARGAFDRKVLQNIRKKHFNSEKEAAPSKGNLYQPMREYASVSGGWVGDDAGRRSFDKYLIPATIITGAAIGFAFAWKNKMVTAVSQK